MEIQELINDVCEELESPSINRQRSRYLKNYLSELLEYQKNNPEETTAPTHLELYCDLNPGAPECRIFDD
jgi:hypothetical protein